MEVTKTNSRNCFCLVHAFPYHVFWLAMKNSLVSLASHSIQRWCDWGSKHSSVTALCSAFCWQVIPSLLPLPHARMVRLTSVLHSSRQSLPRTTTSTWPRVPRYWQRYRASLWWWWWFSRLPLSPPGLSHLGLPPLPVCLCILVPGPFLRLLCMGV